MNHVLPPLRIFFLPWLLAGCTATGGSYPSLAPRPIESTATTAPAGETAPAMLAPDPALETRVAALLASAREAGAAFDTALSAALPAVASAGGVGSESWVAAQQAVTRVQQARAGLVGVVADLDTLRLAQAQRSPPVDTASLDAAWREASARDAAQSDALQSLTRSLPAP